MKASCKDLQQFLRDGLREMPRALSEHIASCDSCAEQLRRWHEISAAAGAMRRAWHSPELLTRIRGALAAERVNPRRRLPRLFPAAWNIRWLAAGASLAVLIVSALIILHEPGRQAPTDPELNKRLLTEQALHEVEKAETAYIESIDRLAAIVKPKPDGLESPLRMNFREKLALIDSAIAECRMDIERNRFNAHLRNELLSMYREKERTLQELLKAN